MRSVDVGDHSFMPAPIPASHPSRGRARSTRRPGGQLHETQLVAHPVIVIEVEADLLG
jgi:hypothetical protein